MARNSLLSLLVLLATTSCIVTGEPPFTVPERTRPQLEAVDPRTTELIQIIETEGGFDDQHFFVTLLSEDADVDVHAVLLTNYGLGNKGGEPWQDEYGKRIISAATLADGKREFSLTWPVSLLDTTHDCKTVTMLVTHELVDQYPYTSCPKDPDDVATLTWLVTLCEELETCSEEALQDCEQLFAPPDGFTYCPDDWQKALEEFNQ